MDNSIIRECRRIHFTSDVWSCDRSVIKIYSYRFLILWSSQTYSRHLIWVWLDSTNTLSIHGAFTTPLFGWRDVHTGDLYSREISNYSENIDTKFIFVTGTLYMIVLVSFVSGYRVPISDITVRADTACRCLKPEHGDNLYQPKIIGWMQLLIHSKF